MTKFHGTILFALFTFTITACDKDVEFVRPHIPLEECTTAEATECQLKTAGRNFKKVFPINSQQKRKADILFIVDTSGSMAYEQEHIRKRFATFIDSLESIDWRVGIATALIHNFSEVPGSGGNLIPFGKEWGAPLFIESTTPNAQNLFRNTIRRPKSCALKNGIDDCDDHERAIYQATLIIARQNEHQFFRRYSDVNIVIVSDEDEKSNGENLEPEDLPETLIANSASIRARSFTVHAIINRPGDKACLDGQGVEYGRVYMQAAELTGGVIGNVCDSDYSNQLRSIAGSITQTAQSLDLPCTLQEAPVVIPVPVLDKSYSYRIQNNKIIFNKPIPGGTEITVEGVCVGEP